MGDWQFRAPPPPGEAEAGGTPTVSVIIPAYQAAGTIAQALDSVLDQTVQPLEIVVCDDGSTDDLDSALEPYRGRIEVLRKENGGEGSAKDAASRAVSGEFVLVLDADDAFLPRRIEAILELARARPDLDILTTDALLEAEGRVIRRSYTTDWTFETVDQRQAILQRNFIFSAAAIRRSRLLAEGGFDPAARYAADWDLWVRLILSGSRAGLVDEPLYRYRIAPTALSANRARLVRGFVSALERGWSFQLSESERRVLAGSLAERRRELLELELRDALAGGRPVRPAALALVRERGMSPRLRVKAAASLASPSLVRRLRPPQTGWVGAGGTFVAQARPVRLLAYTDAPSYGGAEVSLGNLLAELPARYQVTVAGVTPEVVAAVAARRPGTVASVVPDVPHAYNLGRIAAQIAAFRRARPQIAHISMNTPWAARYGITGALLTRGTKLVLVEQSLFPTTRLVPRVFKRFAAARAHAHVAVGRRSAREIERLSALAPGSVKTIYNGLPDVTLPESPEPREQLRVGSVGRLDVAKGYDLLVDAVPELDVLLIGDGPERERLTARANAGGRAGRLQVTGWVDDPRSLLPTMDIFVLPSLSESFPLSVVEAMLAERAIVATDVGSVAEAIIDGETGLLVPPGDVSALRTAIDRLVEDEPLRRRLGRAARAYALERFTSETMVRAFVELYESI